jgi:hypothetical protein
MPVPFWPSRDPAGREAIQADLRGYGIGGIFNHQIKDACELLTAVAELSPEIDAALGRPRVRDTGLLGEPRGHGLGLAQSRSRTPAEHRGSISVWGPSASHRR